MRSSSYYSVPSNKSKKALNSRKTYGRALTIEEAKERQLRMKKKKTQKVYNKKKKKRKHAIFLLTVSQYSDYIFHNPSKFSTVVVKLNKSFPSHSNLDYSKIFITYSELVQGKEITYLIDMQVLESLVKYIIGNKPLYITKKTLLSVEIFCKKNTCSPQFLGYLRQTARRYHIYINI